MTTTVTIKGTHCESCKFVIEDICGEITGVKQCAVDYKTGKTVIDHDEHFTLDAFKKKVEGIGEYTVETL